ncbi:hypothetical protein DAPPUDRAFT_321851 [Daphnia pulex]|uniref:Saposin A-type domain-containing protein n=1 Tax=Daphnia pulex TaxID=6669 RepID=E9GU38_DAPPU|nr:hypothetical protein DAPPUDRAFT_321851 [Daphnia pulex]|eukprot:EFX77043.1 hypothetical protein DAPPUDRAFT_321851 [Daphnia pulex]
MRSMLILLCFVLAVAFLVEAEDVTVGKNPCTWGPSFWCASSENAAKCGSEAIKYCESVKWNVE